MSTLILFTFIQNILFVSTIWVPTHGWYLEWAKAASSGRVLYKDFSFPFPPLYLNLNQICLLFPDPLLASRILDLLVLILLVAGLYKLAELYVSTWTAALLSYVLVTYVQLDPTNTIGGYFECAELFLVWGLYLYLGRQSTIALFSSAIALVAASLVKQNFVVVTLFLLGVSVYRIFKESNLDLRKKNLSFTSGVAFGYLSFSLYLVTSGNFVQFLESMLTGGGKVITWENLTGNLFSEILNSAYFLSLLGLVLSGFVLSRSTPFARKYNIDSLIFGLLIGASLYWSLYTAGMRDTRFLSMTSIVAALISTSVVILRRRKVSGALIATVYMGATTVSVITIWLVSNFTTGIAPRLWAGIVNHLPDYIASGIQMRIVLWDLIFSIGILWILSVAAKGNFLRKFFRYETPRFAKLLNHSSAEVLPEQSLRVSVVLVSLLTSLALNAFNGPVSFNANLPLGALVIAIFLSKLRSEWVLTFFTYFGLSLLIALPMLPAYTYTWFGWDETKTVSVQGSAPKLFSNFALTTTEANCYDSLRSKIENAEKFVTDPSQATVATIPAQPILGWLSNFSDFPLRCPVMHIDICPEKDSKQDLAAIDAGKPDMVIYYALPEKLRNDFDMAYRKGLKSASNSILDSLDTGLHYALREVQVVPTYPDTKVLIYTKIQ